jgi:hypothetical protein
MKAREDWQERYLVEYQAQRKFSVTNLKLEVDATLEVKTTFQRPETMKSQVLAGQGPQFIRERVFDKILEAETETQSPANKQLVDIGPANYTFSYLGRDDCDGRVCYRLRITPKRREKYLIDGQIWIDAEDAGIGRIQGSPAKRPSLWARHTQIVRRYRRIDGMWLSDSLESSSDILIAGRSTLKIQYSFESIQVDPQYRLHGNSPLLTSPSILPIQQ